MNAGRRTTNRALLIVAITLVAVGGFAALLLTRATEPVDPQTAALRAATEGALRSLYSEDVPPTTYEGGPLPSATAAEMRARVVADIGRYFTNRLQARYEPMILGAIDQIGASEWDAQVNQHFDWARASFGGDRATVHVTETRTVVRRGGQYGIGPAASHRLDSTGDWTISLVRSEGEWRVDEIDLDCRSGCP
jgi:hypothetical protein